MNKPVTVVCEEFKQNLANLINNSTLPPFVMEDILKSIYLEVRDIVKKQYEIDVKKYEEYEKIRCDNSVETTDNEGDLVG